MSTAAQGDDGGSMQSGEQALGPVRRVAALDGLRGLAALTVVLEHLLLCIPVLWKGFHVDGSHVSPAIFAFMNSPLRLIWAGEQAVIVFFVLSGLVLTRALRRAQGIGSYYAARATRLLLPVWAAVGLAVVLARVIPWPTFGHQTQLGQSVGRPTVTGIVRDLTLLPGVDRLDTPLWSLAWEARFSLILPVLVWTMRPLAKRPAYAIAAVVGWACIAPLMGNFSYTAAFAAGVALAAAWDLVQERVGAWSSTTAVSAFVASALLLTLRFSVRGVLPHSGVWRSGVFHPAEILGAVGLVVLAASRPGARRLLTTTPVTFLGRRSFSLYVVHWPLIVSLAALGATSWPAIAWLPLGLAVSIVGATVLYHLVERPSQGLARRLSEGRLSGGALPFLQGAQIGTADSER